MIYAKSWPGIGFGGAIMFAGYLWRMDVVGIFNGTYVAQDHALGASIVSVLACIVTGALGFMHERSNDYDGADRAQLLSSILCGIVAAIMLLSSLAPGESRFNAELTIVSTAGIMFILGVILFFPSFGWRSQTRY